MTHPAGGRPVIAAIDGSAGSLRAAHAAAAEARSRNAALELLTAVPWSSFGLVTSPGPDNDLPDVLLSSAETVLRSVAAEVTGTVGPDRVTSTVVEGTPVEVLHEASARGQLLVLGSRGVGGVPGLVIGSTASAVVAHAQCPVLVLPDDTSVSVSRRSSVVVGVEGRDGDEEVLTVAFEEAALRSTDLVAVHAWQDVRLDADFQAIAPLIDWGSVRADEERALAEALAGWRDKQPDVVVRDVVLRDRTARGLLAAALTAELLVIGHRRRNRLAVLGSTTHGVLHRASCPLMVVPLAGTAER